MGLIAFLVVILLLLIFGTVLGDFTRWVFTRAREKKRPFCAEFVKSEAKVCRFCGRDVPEGQLTRGKNEDKKSLVLLDQYVFFLDGRFTFRCRTR